MRKRFLYLYVVAFAVLFLTFANSRPIQNWDMIGYTASVFSLLGHEGADLPERTYAEVRAATDSAHFKALTTGPYRETVHRDPVALEEQLPFYSIRIVYVVMTAAMSVLTGNVADATALVSALSATLLLVAGTAAAGMRTTLMTVLLPVAFLAVGLGPMARTSSPDALAALLALCALWSTRRYPGISLILLAGLPAVRTDFVLLLPFAALLLRGKVPGWQIGVMLATGVLLVHLLNAVFGNYGYLHIFNFTLISGPHPYPSSTQISSDIGDYLGAYRIGLSRLYEQAGATILLFVTFVYLLHRARRHRLQFCEQVTLVGIAFVLAHFLLFPSGFFRVYFPALILSVILWARVIDRYLAARREPA